MDALAGGIVALDLRAHLGHACLNLFRRQQYVQIVLNLLNP